MAACNWSRYFENHSIMMDTLAIVLAYCFSATEKTYLVTSWYLRWCVGLSLWHYHWRSKELLRRFLILNLGVQCCQDASSSTENSAKFRIFIHGCHRDQWQHHVVGAFCEPWLQQINDSLTDIEECLHVHEIQQWRFQSIGLRTLCTWSGLSLQGTKPIFSNAYDRYVNNTLLKRALQQFLHVGLLPIQ